MKRECLRVSNLTVEIDGRKLLNQLSFSVFSGELLAVCGLRFTGKSVLARLLIGDPFPFRGRIFHQGKLCQPGHGAASRDIFYIGETGNTFESLSISDTLFAIRAPRHRQILYRQQAANAQTSVILRRLGIPVQPDAPMSSLSNSNQHLLLIEKARIIGARVVIMDSIADAYTSDEYAALNRAVRESEEMAFMYLTNREDAIVRQADRVLMIRNGCPAGLLYRGDYQARRFSRILSGSPDSSIPRRARHSFAERDLAAEFNLPLRNGDSATFQVRKGEVLGLYDGSGGNAEMLVAALLQSTGDCLSFPDARPADYMDAVRRGLGVVTHNYPYDGCFHQLSPADNLTFQIPKRVSRGLILCDSVIRYLYRETVREYAENEEIGLLETVLLKWTLARPRVLVLENIWIGLSASARKNAARILDQAARDGVAIVHITTDYAACEAFCDRIIVL